jgi:hypothetical protein
VLIPLTKMLNKQEAEYEVKGKNKVSHWFYMDSLKLFSRDKTELQQELNTDDIRMEFGLDKCTTAVFKHGKLTKSLNICIKPDSNKEHGA